MSNQPTSTAGFKPFTNKTPGKRPVALPGNVAQAASGQTRNPNTPQASPHMQRHVPVPKQNQKLSIPDRTPDAPFGFDEQGRPLSATEFANRRLAQQDPSLPRVVTQQANAVQGADTQGAVRKYGEPVALDLPSGYAFYSQFSELYVRPIRGHNMAKFASAWANSSKRQEVEAVSSLLEANAPLQMPVGYYLTLGDYYSLMYRLRFTNYRRPIKHTDICQNEAHQRKVRAGEATRKSLLIEIEIKDGDLEERLLRVAPVFDREIMYSHELDLQISLRPATMLDMVETMEHANFGKDPQWDYLSQLACYIDAPTYEQRMEIASALTPDQIEHMQTYESVLDGYGVNEKLPIKCSHCGHEQRTKLSIDSSTFLPG